MTNPRTYELGRMSWTEAREAAADNPVVLIPVGAIEQHGPHLPLHEDAIVADHVAKQVAAATGALVAPVMNYGHSPMFAAYAGTLSLRRETLTAVMVDICEGLVSHGFRRLVFVDNNGGNQASVMAAAFEMRTKHGILMGSLYPWQLGYQLMRSAYDDPDKVYGHGAEPELSAMLVMFPEQVQHDRIEGGELQGIEGWRPHSYNGVAVPGYDVPGTVYWDFSDVSRSGVSGDTSVASEETGKVWVERVIGFCTAFVREFDANTKDTSWAQQPE
ncbi:MAG: creatininase family protein [Streptosporangiales bacterium]|nr:creatininase family protein [Streptosporangiales bacterium]